MKTKVIYHELFNDGHYYEFIVKETDKSYIVIVIQNTSGHYDKEIRYRKTDAMSKEVAYLIKSKDSSFFRHYYCEDYENGSYWQKWTKIF